LFFLVLISLVITGGISNFFDIGTSYCFPFWYGLVYNITFCGLCACSYWNWRPYNWL